MLKASLTISFLN